MKSLPFARSDAKHGLNFQTSFPSLHIGLSTPLIFYINQSPRYLYHCVCKVDQDTVKPGELRTWFLRTCLKQVLII